jgi:hypothetical protein
MVTLLLAATVLTQSGGAAAPVRLACESLFRPGPGGRQSNVRAVPFEIRLVPEERGFSSVLIDGPPYLSSYRQTADRALLPRARQWRGRMQGRAVRLRREGIDMVLQPERGSADAYSGFWTSVEMVEHRRVETSGLVRCRIVAGTLSESASS